MENENKTFITPEERQKRVEDFILNPDKVMFTSVEELKEAVDEVRNFLKDVDIAELDKLQGEDGKTPVRGVDYFTPQDIQAFEDFILDNFPEVDVDFPSIDSVEKYLDEKVAEIPRIKGDKGDSGKDGKDGKDGSPDSPKDIVNKIRILGNNGLKIKDINGLPAKMTQLNQLSDDLIRLDKIVMDIPVSMGGVNLPPVGGAGTWGSITGTLSDQTDLQSALNGKQTTTLTNGNFLVGNASNVATSVAPSGDVTFSNTGAFTIGAGKVTNSMLAGSINISKIDATGTPSSTTYLRGDGTWATVSGGGGISLTDLSATTPLTYNNTTGVFGINKADGSTNGYLSSTDWNTFNNKQSALGFTPENIANKKTTLADNSDTYYPTQKAVKTAVDAKLNSSALSISTGQVAFGSGSNTIGGDNGLFWDNSNKRLGIGTNNPTSLLEVAGTVKVGAYTLPSTDGSSNQVLKTNGSGTVSWQNDNGISLTSLSASAPLSYDNTTGAFSISQANTSTNGYLSSTDWNTFNAKQDTLVSGTNIKTINSTSLLGSGNIAVEPTITAGTTGQYWRGDKSWQTLNKTAVGLGNVDNTSDATKNSASATLTNKRITKRVYSITSTSTLTPNSIYYDVVKLTAQAAALTIAAPIGTPTDGQPLLIQILDNGTARALTWNAAYVAMGAALPTTTTASKILQVGCIWNAGTSKWLASSVQQV